MRDGIQWRDQLAPCLVDPKIPCRLQPRLLESERIKQFKGLYYVVKGARKWENTAITT
jgi:hypothetical protein